MSVSVEHIALDEKGIPRLAGTRIKVKHLVEVKRAMGYTAEQIQQEAYPHLSMAQVYAALAYYHDHEDEINAAIARDEAFYEKEHQEQLNDPKFQELVAKIRSRAGKL